MKSRVYAVVQTALPEKCLLRENLIPSLRSARKVLNRNVIISKTPAVPDNSKLRTCLTNSKYRMPLAFCSETYRRLAIFHDIIAKMSPEMWTVIEHSSECVERARRASEKAFRLQQTSQELRKRAAELVRYNRAVRTEGGKDFLLDLLRLPDEPSLSRCATSKNNTNKTQNSEKHVGSSVKL